MKRLWILLSLALMLGTAAANAQPATETFAPADNGKALVNPNMGWMLYYYSNVLNNYGSKLAPEDTVEDFPGVGTVFLRLPWAFVFHFKSGNSILSLSQSLNNFCIAFSLFLWSAEIE